MGRARAARGPAGAHRAASRGPRALRGGEAGAGRGSRRRGCRAPPPQDRRTALGGGRPRARERLLRAGPGAARRRTAIRSSAPSCSRRSAGWRFGPATMPARSPGPSGHSRGPRSENGDGADPERDRARSPRRGRRPTTRSASPLPAPGASARQSSRSSESIELAETHDLLQAACRGYTNLGVLYSALDPRRSIDTCLRGLETAKKVGDLGFQSRLYANLAVAYCALTDRCEAEGVEAAQTAIDLDRRLGLLDHLAVPLIVLGQIHQCHGEHALAFASLRGGAGSRRAGRRAAAPVSRATMASLPSISMPGTRLGRAVPGEVAGGVRAGRAGARRPHGPAVSLLTPSNDGGAST